MTSPNTKQNTDSARYKKELEVHQATMQNDVRAATEVLQFESDNLIVVKGRKRATFDHI